MVIDGELWSYVRISQYVRISDWSKNFRFHGSDACNYNIDACGNVEFMWNKECFLVYQFQSCDSVLWKSRVQKLCTCQLFIQSILQATEASIYLTWCDDGY